jgi:hypothetical protein
MNQAEWAYSSRRFLRLFRSSSIRLGASPKDLGKQSRKPTASRVERSAEVVREFTHLVAFFGWI